MSLKYAPYRLMVAVIVAACLALPGLARAQAAPPEKPEKGMASPETLSRGFEQSIAQLQENLKAWESRVPGAAASLAQTQKELDNLQVAVATLKATMVLQRLPLLQVQELLEVYADREKALKGKLKDLGQEIDELKKGRQENVEAQNALRVQLSIIQAKDPSAVTPELQQAFLTYLNLAGERDRLMIRVLDVTFATAPASGAGAGVGRRPVAPVEATGGRLERPATEASGGSGAFPGAGGPGLEEPGRHPSAGLGLAQRPGGVRTPERLYLGATWPPSSAYSVSSCCWGGAPGGSMTW